MSKQTDLTADSIEILFRTFARRWTHRWEKSFSDNTTRKLWKHDLNTLGITHKQMLIGLNRSASLAWPPSPAEFAELCGSTEFPDVDAAYLMAAQSKWQHPVIYESARRVGVYELRTLPESRTRAKFEKTYRAVCDEWMQGRRFTLPEVPALPAPKKTVSRDFARDELKKIHAMLNGGGKNESHLA